MRRFAIVTLLVSVLSAGTGCGTIAGLVKHGPVLYGGVQEDAALVASKDPNPFLDVAAFYDLPFSLVADTLLLPITVTAEIIRAARYQPTARLSRR